MNGSWKEYYLLLNPRICLYSTAAVTSRLTSISTAIEVFIVSPTSMLLLGVAAAAAAGEGMFVPAVGLLKGIALLLVVGLKKRVRKQLFIL